MIRSLKVDKAHDHGNIYIRMLKINHIVIAEPLSIIFNHCINQKMLDYIWKKLEH